MKRRDLRASTASRQRSPACRQVRPCRPPQGCRRPPRPHRQRRRYPHSQRARARRIRPRISACPAPWLRPRKSRAALASRSRLASVPISPRCRSLPRDRRRLAWITARSGGNCSRRETYLPDRANRSRSRWARSTPTGCSSIPDVAAKSLESPDGVGSVDLDAGSLQSRTERR